MRIDFFKKLKRNRLRAIMRGYRALKKEKKIYLIRKIKDDLNIDHRIVNNAVVTACRPQKDLCVKELMFFEVPSSTEYSLSETFSPNYFVDISTTIDLKIHAINIYQSEMRDFPHPRSVKAINSLASWRGSSSGFEYVESFIIGRLLY